MILPDIDPEKADVLDVPISDDAEAPAAEPPVPSQLETQAARPDSEDAVTPAPNSVAEQAEEFGSDGQTVEPEAAYSTPDVRHFDPLAPTGGSVPAAVGASLADGADVPKLSRDGDRSGEAAPGVEPVEPPALFSVEEIGADLAARAPAEMAADQMDAPELAVLSPVADAIPETTAASVDAEQPFDENLLAATDGDAALPEAEATPDAIVPAPPAGSGSAFVPRFDMAPVRFVWQIDRDGKFRSLTPEFSAAVGPRAADVAGRSFREVATVFGFDDGGEIARLLDRRDTWSGRSILWPVEASDRKVPVDLAALPIYARDRSFDGFRGFGIVRMNESVVDPEAIGLILSDPPMPAEEPVRPLADLADEEAPFDAAPARPLLTTYEARAFGRRQSAPAGTAAEAPADEAPAAEAPKVIRLEERRRPREGALSQAEEAAFRAIGMKLGEGSKPAAPEVPIAPAEPAASDAADDVLPPADPAEEAPASLFQDDVETTESGAAAAEPFGEAVDDAPAEDGEPVSEATLQADIEELSTEASDVDAAPSDLTDSANDTTADDDVAVGEDAWEAETAVAPEPPSVSASPWASDFAEPIEETPPQAFGAMTDQAAERLAVLAEAETLPVETPLHDLAEPLHGEDADLEDEDPAALAAELEAVFASLPLPVLAEAHGLLLYANREFQDLTGYESIEALEASGGLDQLFTDPVDPARTGELAIRRSNGHTIDVRVHMQRATFSGRSCLLMSFTPSPRDAVAPTPPPPEAADLRQQVEELQAVLDTATDGVVLLDPAGMIRAMNGSAHALFGIAQDDHSGRHLSSLFAHESQKATVDYLELLRDDGLAGILNDGREVIGRVAQGGFIPLFITIGRLSGERGWCVVIRDIAHWKRIEEDLVNARRQAEAASLHKSRFLANISHELRTPLNAIIGFADVMASECFGPIGNERYLEYLGDIKRSGHHVLDLVNDLLDISKIEAGKLDLAFEAVSLNEVVSEVVSLMQPQANRERVIVRSNLPSSVPPVVADRRTMRQIALNLVANAIRFTPAGGQIIASTTYTADGDVLLRFRDSGIGMTEREIEIALTPFQQVHAPSANRGEGTGLGLPLTKAMVEANRALFAISSTPNEGTLVEISFPSQRVLAD